MESLIPISSALTAFSPVIEKVISKLRGYNADTASMNTIDPKVIGEHISTPLIRMHACLNKADEQLNILNDQLTRSSGQAQMLIINQLSGNYIMSVHKYLEEFIANFDQLSNLYNDIGKKVIETINGYSCATREQKAVEVENQKNNSKSNSEFGNPLKIYDVISYSKALKEYISCYMDGVTRTLEEIPHFKYNR